jgi:membrane AbrB-like protein
MKTNDKNDQFQVLRGLADHRNMVATYVLAFAVGFLAMTASIPLPWMLGPLFVLAISCSLGAPLVSWKYGRRVGQLIMGISMGLYFIPEVMWQLITFLPMIVGGALGSVAIGMIGAKILMRMGETNPTTAFYAAMPGGASEMVSLAEKYAGDVGRIASAHSLRILLVVSTVPVGMTLLGVQGSAINTEMLATVQFAKLPWLFMVGLAGIVFFKLIRIRNAWFLGALTAASVCTALGYSATAMPPAISALGQVLIAVSLGTQFNRQFIVHAPMWLVKTLSISVIEIILSLAMAIAIAWWMPVGAMNLILSFAPGGMIEMGITAKVLHLAVPLVVACHVTRVFILTLIAPRCFRTFFLKSPLETKA